MPYTPPSTPNINLDFTEDPYTPPTTPTIYLNFTEGIGPPPSNPVTIRTSAIILLLG